jgi:hypothetical protein
MTRASPRRFLSRGPGEAAPDDETLLSLVPAGEAVPFERVLLLLTDVRLGELSTWAWVTTGDCCWPPLREYRVIAEMEIRGAINRCILTLSKIAVESPQEPSLLTRLSGSISGMLMSRHHADRRPRQSRARVEREADAILQALHF